MINQHRQVVAVFFYLATPKLAKGLRDPCSESERPRFVRSRWATFCDARADALVTGHAGRCEIDFCLPETWRYGHGSKPIGSHLGIGAPPSGWIGMFTGGTGF